jgi:rhodanese-related sulfurtransferase
MNIRFRMKLSFAVSMMLALPQISLAQTTTIQTATLGQTQKTAEISTAELRRILAENSAVVLDTRPFMEFAVGHIPGALNVSAKPGVPVSLYVSDIAEIERLLRGDKQAPVVLYCNGPFCGKSSRLAEELLQAGFTNVRRYQLVVCVRSPLAEPLDTGENIVGRFCPNEGLWVVVGGLNGAADGLLQRTGAAE